MKKKNLLHNPFVLLITLLVLLAVIISCFFINIYIGLVSLILCAIPTPLALSKVWAWITVGFAKEQPQGAQPEPDKTFTGITSISVLLLKDFIQIIVHNNLKVLGEGTPLQLQQAYSNILSEYYAIKKDQNIKKGIKLRADIGIIEVHWKLVNSLNEMMQERYSLAGAEIFRKLYPTLLFTVQSFSKDIERVKIIEIKTKIKYRHLEEELKLQDKESKTTPAEKHRALLNTMANINKVEGFRAVDMTMTVLEFANYENRLQEYIKNLESQKDNFQ